MRKQKGGGITDDDTAMYIVAFIAALNLIAYVQVRDWNSIAFLILSGGVTFAATSNKILSLVVAVVAGSLFRASSNLREGLTKHQKQQMEHITHNRDERKHRRKEKREEEEKEEEKTEGFTEALDAVHKNNKSLSLQLSNLEPLMNKASKLLDSMPKGFVKEALNKFKYEKKGKYIRL